MNNSVLIPVMVVLGLALISGLVIIPEIAESQSESQSTEEEFIEATDLKKLDKIIENQEIIKDQLSEIYDLNS